MATLSGSVLTGHATLPYAGLASQLPPVVEQWRLPYIVYAPPTPPIAGVTPVARTQPLDNEPEQVRGGAALTAFVADYYNRIHVLPGILRLGSILGTQTRAVEVWNSYFEPRGFLSVSVTNAGGTTLVPVSVDAPLTMGALQSVRYTLTISASGPATLAAQYQFLFDIGAFYLDISGQRTAIFAFPPDWAEPVIERLAWMTNVMQSLNGNEQRVARRLIPRRQFEFTVSQYLDQFQYLDSLLVGWQARVYAFPIWTDAQQLRYDITAGTSEINCNTADRDFYVGGYAVITSDARHSEAVQIEEVLSDRIVLTKPTDRSWNGRARIAPARLGRLNAEVEARRPTAKLGKARVVFDVQDITAVAPLPETTVYRGGELVLRKPNRAEDVTVTYRRLQDRVDYDDGVIDVYDRGSRSFNVRSYDFLLRDRAETMKFRRWLHARQGQLKPFWMPVWENNLEIIGPTNTNDTSIIVKAQGLVNLLSIDNTRRDLAIYHKNGTWRYLQIAQFGEGGDEDQEVVFLTSAIGITTVPGDFIFASFIDYVTLNADEFEISYLKDDAATARLATRSVIA